MPLSTSLSYVLVAFTIELDNEYERRLHESGHAPRVASWVMWANFMRFVGDGISVGELPAASGIAKARVLSNFGGMERWRYVYVGDDPETKRDGWGSGRGLRADWVVRLTPSGRAAEEIWRPLPDEIEARWRERFGADAIDELRRSLEAIVGQLDVELPQYLPLMGGASWTAADTVSLEGGRRESSSRLPLPALLAQALLAYTLDFEREAGLALPLSANIVRVLDETGAGVGELPRRAGISKEAVAMALRFLEKNGYVSVKEKVASLTPQGREEQEQAPRVHAAVEAAWRKRFGADAVGRLAAALQDLLDRPEELARGLEPHPGGWRATKPYLAHTEALLENPIAALPHYPMVLHRGGWPDGA